MSRVFSFPSFFPHPSLAHPSSSPDDRCSYDLDEQAYVAGRERGRAGFTFDDVLVGAGSGVIHDEARDGSALAGSHVTGNGRVEVRAVATHAQSEGAAADGRDVGAVVEQDRFVGFEGELDGDQIFGDPLNQIFLEERRLDDAEQIRLPVAALRRDPRRCYSSSLPRSHLFSSLAQDPRPRTSSLFFTPPEPRSTVPCRE